MEVGTRFKNIWQHRKCVLQCCAGGCEHRSQHLQASNAQTLVVVGRLSCAAVTQTPSTGHPQQCVLTLFVAVGVACRFITHPRYQVFRVSVSCELLLSWAQTLRTIRHVRPSPTPPLGCLGWHTLSFQGSVRSLTKLSDTVACRNKSQPTSSVQLAMLGSCKAVVSRRHLPAFACCTQQQLLVTRTRTTRLGVHLAVLTVDIQPRL